MDGLPTRDQQQGGRLLLSGPSPGGAALASQKEQAAAVQAAAALYGMHPSHLGPGFESLSALQLLQAHQTLGGMTGLLQPILPFPAPPSVGVGREELLDESRRPSGLVEPSGLQPCSSDEDHNRLALEMMENTRRRTASSNGGASGLTGRGSGGGASNQADTHAQLKEKNRQAQQRFRQRQKCLIEDLRNKVESLQQKVAASEQEVTMLRKENSELKNQLDSAKAQAFNLAALGSMPPVGLPHQQAALQMLLSGSFPPPSVGNGHH